MEKSEDGEQSHVTTDAPAQRPPERLVYPDQEPSSGVTFQGQAEDVEGDGDASSAATHPRPSLSSSPSSSSCLCLSPPLPPFVELRSVLADTRLTLDVYRGGAAALPRLWESVPEELMEVQYLTLGSEEKEGLDEALDMVPCLTNLQTLTIRGTVMKTS